jgi:hypothetical protein
MRAVQSHSLGSINKNQHSSIEEGNRRGEGENEKTEERERKR